jgi:hypothetical protein
MDADSCSYLPGIRCTLLVIVLLGRPAVRPTCTDSICQPTGPRKRDRDSQFGPTTPGVSLLSGPCSCPLPIVQADHCSGLACFRRLMRPALLDQANELVLQVMQQRKGELNQC